jgi:hypothetical protein
MFQPCEGEVTWKWIWIVSPAFITRGDLLVPSYSSALNAASLAPLCVLTCQTGEHTLNLSGAWVTLKPPSDEQVFTIESG